MLFPRGKPKTRKGESNQSTASQPPFLRFAGSRAHLAEGHGGGLLGIEAAVPEEAVPRARRGAAGRFGAAGIRLSTGVTLVVKHGFGHFSWGWWCWGRTI